MIDYMISSKVTNMIFSVQTLSILVECFYQTFGAHMYYIIFNPTAGAGRSVKVMQAVLQHLEIKNIAYKVAETQYARHAVKLAHEAVGKGYKGIISVGGDGTLLEVAGELHGTEETLGIIPAGTGNDFRQAVHVSKDPVEALETILNGHSKKVDIGFLGEDRPFLNVAGTGFDVEVIRNTEKVRRLATGGLAYFIGILMSLFRHKSVNIEIKANGETLKRKVLLIAIANGKCFGGGLKVAPHSSVTDGLFNVLIINHVPNWRILVELPKLKKGQIEKISVAEQFKCSDIYINSEIPLNFDLDGDVYGQTPSSLHIKPAVLRVFCPNY
jgi:YegS/Rv2252/BmrU family lipid kinase